MSRYKYPLINTVVLAITLFVNYISNTGVINGKNIGEVSNEYSNLVTPAGYAFSIWGLIYLALIALIVYQWIIASRSDQSVEGLHKVGYKLAIANSLNCLWVLLWLNGLLAFSVIVMIGILITLTRLTIDLSQWHRNTSADNWLIKFPIYIYQGWIVVALVANMAAFLTGFSGNYLFSESVWAVLVIAVALGIYIFQSNQLKQSVSALVGVWGIAAIGVKQMDATYVGITALVMSVILLTIVFISSVRNKSIF